MKGNFFSDFATVTIKNDRNEIIESRTSTICKKFENNLFEELSSDNNVQSVSMSKTGDTTTIKSDGAITTITREGNLLEGFGKNLVSTGTLIATAGICAWGIGKLGKIIFGK